MLSEHLIGTWESDHERTLWELRRTLGPAHKKTRQYSEDRSSLILHYTKHRVTYYFRDMVCSAAHRILSEDEHTLVSEVEPCDLNEQGLWQLHFLDAKTYWVTVDLDWGICYREFFRKLDDDPDEDDRSARAMNSWTANLEPDSQIKKARDESSG